MPAQLHLSSRCWSDQHSATTHPAPDALGQFKGKQCLPLACSMEHLPLLGQLGRCKDKEQCTDCKRAMMLVIRDPAVRQGSSAAAVVMMTVLQQCF